MGDAFARMSSILQHHHFFSDMMKQQDRALRKVDRDLARDRTGLERQEKMIVSQICACSVMLYIVFLKFGSIQCCQPKWKNIVDFNNLKIETPYAAWKSTLWPLF